MCKPRPSTEPGHVLTGREVIDTHLRQVKFTVSVICILLSVSVIFLHTLVCVSNLSVYLAYISNWVGVVGLQGLQYGMRDFVQSWFHVWVSPNPAFPGEVQRAVVTVVTELTRRLNIFFLCPLQVLFIWRVLFSMILHTHKQVK